MSNFGLSLSMMGMTMMSAAVSAAGPPFPGPSPGTARAQASNGRLLLENDLLAVRWDLSDGLHLIEAVDKLNGQTWATGPSECLQIVFYRSPSPQALTLLGSQMEVLGEPIVTATTVSHASQRQSQRYAGKQIVVRLAARDGSLTVRWRASLRNEANYVRQSVQLQAGADWVELNQVILLDLPAQEVQVFGSVDGSPVVAGRWFMGLEHPMSANEVIEASGAGARAGHRVRCSYQFAPPLEPEKSQQYSAVLGLTPKGQLRRGFLYYLERERAHPYRSFLLHSTGEDTVPCTRSLEANLRRFASLPSSRKVGGAESSKTLGRNWFQIETW